MDSSILIDIKKMIGILEDDGSFDVDITTLINSTFFTLIQVGIGPKDGYRITDKNNKWNEFVSSEKDLYAIKEYIYIKVKLSFDPPLNSSLLSSFKELLKELEWRLNISNDKKSEN